MADSPGVKRVPSPTDVQITGVDTARSGENVAVELSGFALLDASERRRAPVPRICYLLNQAPSDDWISAFDQLEGRRYDDSPFRARVEKDCIYVGFDASNANNRHETLEESIHGANHRIREKIQREEEQARADRERVESAREAIARFAEVRGLSVKRDG